MSASTLTPAERTLTMLGALLGLLLAALDQTIVSTAGPTIQRELAIAPSLYTWITTSYLVASTVCVPIYGKLSDLYGRKPILLSGIAIFLTGSVLCGLSGSAVALILARAVQGVGAASLFTSAFAIVADLFPPQERGKWQGLFGACFGLSSVIGPLVGGFLTDRFGWHWVFFVNLPIGLAALAFIVAKMPALRQATGPVRLDLAGTAALVLAVVPLLLALSLGRATVSPGETGWLWTSAPILGMFGLSVAGGVAFLVAERRAVDPIVDLALFRERPFALGTLATFVAGAAFLGAIVFLPLFMVNVVGLSATHSGLTTTPLTLGIVGGNILTGQIVARVGRYKFLMLGSLVVLLVGFGVLASTLSVDSTQGELTVKMILLGLGLGPSIPLFTLHLQSAVPPHRVGVATSTGTFARQLGSTVGIALLGTVFGATLTRDLSTGMAAAAQGLPPEMVAQLRGGGVAEGGSPSAPTESEGGTPRSFDAAALERRVHAAFEGRRSALRGAAAQGDPRATQALTALQTAENDAVAGVRRLHLAFRTALANAIAHVYGAATLIAVLAIALVLMLPELPLLRGPKGAAPPPPAE
jgi:EmrB/QacA subfamily drug resistance transporter